MAALDDFDEVIEPYHLALGEIIKGNPEGYEKLYSHRDDQTLANPFGPPALGWDEVARTLDHAASHYTSGELTGLENVSKYVSAELAYLVEVERFEAKVGPREDAAPVALRVTSIFRSEDGTWKVVDRHADPIITPQPAESVIQQ
jgi:ketosteroid isomerase-like protein